MASRYWPAFGVSHYSKILENVDENAVFDELFEWPVARPIESEEQIDIQLFNYNKYLSNRLLGSFRMVLQQLIEVGHLNVSDCLLDDNNVLTKTCLTFELTYNAPDGSVGTWQKSTLDLEEGSHVCDDERHLLAPDKGASDSDSMPSSPSKSFRGSRLRSIKSIGKMMKLGKQRPAPDDEQYLLGGSREDIATDQEISQMEERLLVPPSRADDDSYSDGQTSNSAITAPVTVNAKKAKPQSRMGQASLKAQDFQVERRNRSEKKYTKHCAS
ncbi:hypothetical protein CAPTEDRAFT_185768 [Capitella teleta]|uniref:Uncharacterized protein n=1 Tax=Capitella teleta TaxID=283909 RepID=R7VIC2_CAPTE|nr:hypothetical protein CAPTEDRAFT_185768 [Capitella teleta]|eukprot:ELU18287.1 hypothetical protein CAPTEDRAFT_185768 [Capitella teleta]